MHKQGTIAFLGGGAFVANDAVDHRLLAEAGARSVVVLPTADAFGQPADLVAAAVLWGERLGVEVDPLMVLQRHDADDDEAVAVIDGATAVYLAGDSSMHLRSVLKGTAVLEAVRRLLDRDGLVAAVGPSAAAISDPMFDGRGGGFTLGLGLCAGVAIIPETERWSDEALTRTRSLATTPLIALPTGAAAILRSGAWELVGAAEPSADLNGG